MLKDAGYQEKIELLSCWLEEIINTVKKDLKNEHLKIDRQFSKKYFLGRNPNTVSIKEMAEAYRRDILDGNVGLGEFIATRWLLKNTDIYGYFETHLKQISEDFENLDELPEELSAKLLKESIERFGAKKTYIFSVFNSVVFPNSAYSGLKELANKESDHKQQEIQEMQIIETIESLQKRHGREFSALQDRYEKKLSGLQKKYLKDIEALKKQISSLQKKLNER